MYLSRKLRAQRAAKMDSCVLILWYVCVCVPAWRANSFRVVDDNKRQRGIYWDIYEMKFPMEFYHFHSEERWRFGRSMKIIDREKDKALFRYERNEQRLRQFFDYRQQNFLLSLCSALFAYSNCWRQLFQTIFVRKKSKLGNPFSHEMKWKWIQPRNSNLRKWNALLFIPIWIGDD